MSVRSRTSRVSPANVHANRPAKNHSRPGATAWRPIGASTAAIGAMVSVVACGDAVTLEIASDRPVPQAIDSICVAIADNDLSGGHFGKHYALEGKLGSLPQTLRVEAGGADEAIAWVRGDRGGVPAARAASTVDFADDVTLGLSTCVKGPGGAPASTGAPIGPLAARLVASQGQGGTIVVALGTDGAAIVDARGHALAATPIELPGANATAAVALDIDGDCDDDLAVAANAKLQIWRRDGRAFVDAGMIDTTVSALAAADVDRDGASDLIVANAGSIALYRNDGGGGFSPSDIPANGITDVSALATGDLDGDGNADLVAGQRNAGLRAWFGNGGTFTAANGATPSITLDVTAMQLADLDNDYDPDLAIAVAGAPMHILLDRGGLLEEQSFVWLPDPAPTADALAIGGWDDGCEPDLFAVSATTGTSLRGTKTGSLEAKDAAQPGGRSIVFADIDDDGDLDAIVGGAEGVTWLAR